MKRMAIIVVMSILLLASAGMGHATQRAQGSEVRATVVIEFGNHQDFSYTVTLPQDNHTALKATELACENLSLDLEYTWSSYGAMVNKIGWEENDWAGTGYYWHLLVWGNDSYSWSMSNVGASSLMLKDGEVIAWMYTVDTPGWTPWAVPSDIPGHYSSVSSMRGNINNTGEEYGNILGNDTLWKFRAASQWGFSSTPIFHHGMIFVADSSNLYALNPNGTLVWNSTKGASGYYGIASPAAFGDYVIIGTGDKYVRAFYASNGTMAWEHYIGENVTSSPVIDVVNKYPVVFVATFVMNNTGKLFALNLTNGEELWNITLMGSDYFGVPAIEGGRIYVPVAGIENMSYKWNGPYGIQCIGEDGRYLWNLSIDSSIRSSPVVYNGSLYFVTTGGNLSSVDASTGDYRWNYTIHGSTSSPAVHNGIIYVADDAGNVYAVRDDNTGGTLLWKKGLGEPVKASVLYAGGRVAVVTDSSRSEVHVFSDAGDEVWNFTIPSSNSYVLSSPVLADSTLLIASGDGYLYALTDNATIPKIGEISNSPAIAGERIKLSFSSQEEYQAFLFYRNVSGTEFHCVVMNYTGGQYVGYIPAQDEGVLEYYVTVVSPSGETTSSNLSTLHVSSAVPEFVGMPVFLLLLALLAVAIRKL